MKKRFLSILLVFCMVMAFMPQVAYATGNAGDFTVTGGTSGIDYYYNASNKTLRILTGTPITISGTTTSDKIFVEEEVSANITLAGVNIDLSLQTDSTAIALSGNTTITLAENTTNTVKSGYWCAGISNNSNLEIKGSGTLVAQGGQYGAGIGGGYNGNGSNITISGGTVKATGGYGGAGIGGGYNGDGSNITISGGTVNATGGTGGAGIGGGSNRNGSNIIISGGSVKAKGNNDIGGGMSGSEVCPKADDGTNAYLFTIDNRNSDTVFIDGNEYQPVNHTSADSSDTNLYVYLTGTNHIIKVGENVVNYHFDSTTFSECKDNDKDHLCDACSSTISEHSLEKIPAKAATVTKTGSKEYWHCLDCGKNFSDADGTNEITDLESWKTGDGKIDKLPPEIIEGKGQSITAGEEKALSFTSNAAIGDFLEVQIDGKTLDAKYYTVKEGSTIVDLKADYVATLSAGEHTIGIVSTSGTAVTTFTVAELQKPTGNNSSTGSVNHVPQTGDATNLALWIILSFVSGILLSVLGIYGKKKKHNR